jgi:hypothetical protein
MSPSQIRAFAAQASTERRAIWPVTVTASGSVGNIAGAKSPTRIERVQQEHGGGWVQRAIATFLFPVTGSFAPGIGAELTVVAYEKADEVGTQWRCFDIQNGDPNTGADHRLVCFRLD